MRFETPSESYVPRGLAVGLIPSSWDLLLAISSVLEKRLKSTGSQCLPMNRPSQTTLQWRLQVGCPQHTHTDSNHSCGSFIWDRQGQPREQVKHKKQNLKQKYPGSRKLQKVNHQYPQKSKRRYCIYELRTGCYFKKRILKAQKTVLGNSDCRNENLWGRLGDKSVMTFFRNRTQERHYQRNNFQNKSMSFQVDRTD